ncbi:MAG: 3-phosphoshikimate 1-carboxyvinyltransferase [Planctomycetota bacterium]
MARGTATQLPDPLPLPTLRPGAAFDLSIRPPGSKSLTNRALLLAALAEGESTIREGLTDADDAERMIAAIQQLGAGVRLRGGELRVQGVGGTWRPESEPTLNLNNAGTATRFLTAAALLSAGPIVIDGNARMRERPIGELGDALRVLGATVEHLGERDGCPPIRVTPPAQRPRAAELTIGRTKSSQFLTGLLQLGPWLESGLTLRSPQGITSESYVRMSLRLLEAVGAQTQCADDLRFVRVRSERPGGGLAAFDLTIEPDASGATYWWSAAAMVPDARITVPGLNADSLQADARFPELLSLMGAHVEGSMSGTVVRGTRRLVGIRCDMADMPDAAMSLAVVAAFADSPTTISGLSTLRDKECDRIDATRAELAKIGVLVETRVDGDDGTIRIVPPDGGIDCAESVAPVEFDTYDDHRMAMSTALIALRRPNVLIRDPGCVAKTYPGYWADFRLLRG